MSELKNTVRADLKAAMKAKDETGKKALRMLLSAIQTEEVSGEKHELTDEDVLRLIAREIKKRNESAEVYAANGREELAQAELAEAEVFARYQPAQLDDAELDTLVADTVAAVAGDETPSMKMMGQVMKAAAAKAGPTVDGKRLSAAVKAHLAG
ncbi:GatB/YqeY domain-containing protein [Corynebacterium mendelii]|uniref:GatB/YqeY domain-containing protein n=1 Tax=Corynebacterium mendelii TaxID=2765362 RepID=A0A939DZ89_9CORY|nr:GatB/YqeY domain-containing protein [Corynebacterium mendelii]MBN9643768.1 GatB/YqeY domain-containing protein [Corynebacterium mendelii]